MQSTAIHTRLFAVVYGTAKRSNIERCVYISIHIVSAVIAFKHLSFPVAYMVTVAASLACISWINQNNRNTVKNSFIGNVLTQLIERPFTYTTSKLFAFFQRRKTDAFKVFQSNPFVFFFRNLNNLFGNGVIDNRSGGTFSARKPFQEFFTSSCAFALNGASYFLSFYSISFKLFRVKFFSITKGRQDHQTKVNAQERFYVFHIIFNYINSLKQIEFTFSKKQICFAFDIRQVVRVVADKRHFQPAANRPDGNNVVGFVGQDATVIRDRAKWFESPFNLLIQLVGISHFRYAPYDYLTAQLRSTLNGMVAGIMQLKLLKGFLLPSYVGNKITSLVRLFNRLKQTFSLFIGGQQLYFQREFHNANIQLFQVQENILFTLKALGVVAYLPLTLRDEWVSRSFI